MPRARIRLALPAVAAAFALALGGCGPASVGDLADSVQNLQEEAERMQADLEALQVQLDRGEITRRQFDRRMNRILTRGANVSLDESIEVLEDSGAIPPELHDELDAARTELERQSKRTP